MVTLGNLIPVKFIPGDFQQFLLGENRYASLQLSFPEKAQELYEKAARDARERYESYLRLTEG